MKKKILIILIILAAISIGYYIGSHRSFTDDPIRSFQSPSSVNSLSQYSVTTTPKAKQNTYVLNTNTKKFHYPNCSSVKQMLEKNKKIVTMSRDEVINAGYKPCGRCHP